MEEKSEYKGPAALRQTQAPEPLKDALKAQLQLVLDKPLSTRMLLELSQTAELAHKLLIVAGDPRPMRKRHRGNMMLGNVGLGAGSLGDVIGPEEYEDLDPVPAPFGMQENFGAQALQNMVAEAGRPKLPELIRSLGMAQDMLTEQLEKDPEKLKQRTVDMERRVAIIEKQVNEALAANEDPTQQVVGLPVSENVYSEELS
jgi:hypothetical protein